MVRFLRGGATGALSTTLDESGDPSGTLLHPLRVLGFELVSKLQLKDISLRVTLSIFIHILGILHVTTQVGFIDSMLVFTQSTGAHL